MALFTLQVQVKVNNKLDASTEAIIYHVGQLRLNIRQEKELCRQARESLIKYSISSVRNAKVIGREDVNEELAQKICPSQPRAAFCRLGGV